MLACATMSRVLVRASVPAQESLRKSARHRTMNQGTTTRNTSRISRRSNAESRFEDRRAHLAPSSSPRRWPLVAMTAGLMRTAVWPTADPTARLATVTRGATTAEWTRVDRTTGASRTVSSTRLDTPRAPHGRWLRPRRSRHGPHCSSRWGSSPGAA